MNVVENLLLISMIITLLLNFSDFSMYFYFFEKCSHIVFLILKQMPSVVMNVRTRNVSIKLSNVQKIPKAVAKCPYVSVTKGAFLVLNYLNRLVQWLLIRG